MTTSARVTWILNFLVGFPLFAFGVVFLALEMQQKPTHSGHIYAFVGVALLGALVIRPEPIVGGLRALVIVIQPLWPWKTGQDTLQRMSGKTSIVPDDNTAPPGER